MKKQRILFLVENLLGGGHGRRISTLASTCKAKGAEVCIASGTVCGSQEIPVAKLETIRWKNSHFSELVDAEGTPIAPELWRRRDEALQMCIRSFQPTSLVVEGFPFARRRFSDEITQAITAARERGASILCSVRDILQPPASEKRSREAVERMNSLFDLLIVHGDQKLVGFDVSFPDAQSLTTPIRYTGYIDASDAGRNDIEMADANGGKFDIIVAAGGGAAGQKLYETAIASSKTALGAQWRWLVLTGSNAIPATHDGKNLTISANRPDYRALLARARCSISQCGYNTMLDLSQTSCPAIVTPFEGKGEKEQWLRATRLATENWWSIVSEASLSPELLAEATQKAIETGPIQHRDIQRHGAEKSAALILSFTPDQAPVSNGL